TALEPTPLRVARREATAGQQDETESLPQRCRDLCDPASASLQERHRWGSAPTPRSVRLVGRRPTLTATGRSVLYPAMHHPLRYRLDVRHDPHVETPFMQNRSCCFCLTCAPAWAKTCIKE